MSDGTLAPDGQLKHRADGRPVFATPDSSGCLTPGCRFGYRCTVGGGGFSMIRAIRGKKCPIHP